MNMFRRKSLKWQCENSTSKRQEKIRLYSDSLSLFQSSFSEFCVKILDKHLWKIFFPEVFYDRIMRLTEIWSPWYLYIDRSIFNWVTLTSIPWFLNIWTSSNLHHAVHLLYGKMWSFAHIPNESNLAFPWHVRNLLLTPLKTRNKKRNSIEDATFYQIKTNLPR